LSYKYFDSFGSSRLLAARRTIMQLAVVWRMTRAKALDSMELQAPGCFPPLAHQVYGLHQCDRSCMKSTSQNLQNQKQKIRDTRARVRAIPRWQAQNRLMVLSWPCIACQVSPKTPAPRFHGQCLNRPGLLASVAWRSLWQTRGGTSMCLGCVAPAKTAYCNTVWAACACKTWYGLCHS
jgi:hypothetical protein